MYPLADADAYAAAVPRRLKNLHMRHVRLPARTQRWYHPIYVCRQFLPRYVISRDGGFEWRHLEFGMSRDI
jgi:hypothetical protein